MFKVTKRDFDRPGSMYYVDISLNGERVPRDGPGLIGQGDSEEYLQKVLGGILQDAYNRGVEAGREDAAVKAWNRGYEKGVERTRGDVKRALDRIPV